MTLNQIAWQYHVFYPDFIIPGIHIHPEYPEKSAAEIENHSKKGVRLAGELVPYLIGYCSTYLMEGYYELFDLCMQNNMFISIHK